MTLKMEFFWIRRLREEFINTAYMPFLLLLCLALFLNMAPIEINMLKK